MNYCIILWVKYLIKKNILWNKAIFIRFSPPAFCNAWFWGRSVERCGYPIANVIHASYGSDLLMNNIHTDSKTDEE
ncbi:Uncharacterised protein [Leminorella grimontii]|nr:hypothetical protein GLGR_2699 [Leminorella grimontii ATCC 33999 = DSM 5078]VFS61964.1 Uncharacterised protein [Leminorella grimontii]